MFNNTEKIVMSPVKIDFHIHSSLSKHKDKEKVEFNTIDNLPVLVEKLNKNEINVCSITDHDVFDYNMYKTLKLEEGKGSINKVLPGVEFSVEFDNGKYKKTLHIVTIFDDKNYEKVKRIQEILNDENNLPKYDQINSYSEKKFLEILKKIDLNTIMIAHQKNTPSSQKVREHDANTLGDEKFKEFLFTEYFEAYEFRNKNYEVFMNNYVINNDVQDLLRLITGSDCHSWEVYPNESKKAKSNEFVFTWLKCLPTFKGVAMAMTDYRRIKKNNSFFNPTEEYLESINLTIRGNNLNIPLSKGINVIIGDNSIGKSLLLHKLTNYIKEGKDGLQTSIKSSYESHMEDNDYSINTKIDTDKIFLFDMQGEIRKKFEENKLKGKDFLGQFFPDNINIDPYKTIVENEINKFINSLKSWKKYKDLENGLTIIDFNHSTEVAESVTFINNLKQELEISSKYESLEEVFKQLFVNIQLICADPLLDREDKEFLINTVKILNEMFNKYKKRNQNIKTDNSIKNIIFQQVKLLNDTLQNIVSDTQKVIKTFENQKSNTVSNIVELIKIEKEYKDYVPNIQTIKVEPKCNDIFNYSFITKTKTKEISNEYIKKVIMSVFDLKKIKSLSSKELYEKDQTYESLVKQMSPEGDVYDNIRVKALDKFKLDFKCVQSINVGLEKDKFKELSQGFNSQIYFDLISYDEQSTGIYLVDQPEDNVSQKAIKDYLLDRFKTMSSNRQIILVTHNPQFIVNLDVDNVIYLGKDVNGLFVQSGALEYSNNEYDILKIVADNIDGGVESINRRWKRYEKNINI